eukprot:GHRR01014318.1.p1 GENE.GHRR01014318.1~~GHRR01014318.1.p1  ORF type:complete len:480 (+),score=126.92 GHRR01014318.1:194-1633(+)
MSALGDPTHALALPQFLWTPINAETFPQTPVTPRVAKSQIEGLRALDASPKLNLASFVTTFMEPECVDVMNQAIDVNYIDTEEYPSTEKIKDMCVSMLGDLWHADTRNGKAVGTDTVGSSEGALLGALALKRRWQDRRSAEGRDISKPNIVMGTEAHVVWEKFTNYFEVEAKWVPNRPGKYMADNDDLVAACDENTIGVVAILGTTYTGAFYDVEGLDKLIDNKNKQTGWGLSIHVDAASGGFVAPFALPELKWDFRLKTVASVNASGHKYGLVYPGIGWVMWRSREHLPESLVFHDSYLGKDQVTVTLNFSKSAMNVVGQLYQFVRMGFEGYREVIRQMQHTTQQLSKGLEKFGIFEIISSDKGLPLVTFHLKDDETRPYDEFHLADRLRENGWVVPAYRLAQDNDERKVLRVVCRWDFSPTLAAELLANMQEALDWLQVRQGHEGFLLTHYSVYLHTTLFISTHQGTGVHLQIVGTE